MLGGWSRALQSGRNKATGPGHFFFFLVWNPYASAPSTSGGWFHGWNVRFGFRVSGVSGMFRHLGIPGNWTGWDHRPVRCPSSWAGYPVRTCVWTLSCGQGLGCPWGIVTPTKKNICVPFQLVQKKSMTRPSNSRNPFGHVRSLRFCKDLWHTAGKYTG